MGKFNDNLPLQRSACKGARAAAELTVDNQEAERQDTFAALPGSE